MPYEPISGQPQHASDEETMSVIRAVLTEAEDAKEARPSKQRLVEREQKTDGSGESGLAAFVSRSSECRPRRRAEDLPDLAEAAPKSDRPKRTHRVARRVGAVSQIVSRLRAFRPSTRQLALACLALLVVVRPHWFLISGVLFLACLVGFFLILGSDRIWRGVVSYLTRVDASDPAKGARLRAGLDRFACRWDSVLDWFPDGMVDGLYMPDLQAMESAEAAHADAMAERLERMAHDG